MLSIFFFILQQGIVKANIIYIFHNEISEIKNNIIYKLVYMIFFET